MSRDIFFDHNRTWLYQAVPVDTPYSVNIEPTSICNLKCKYCIHGSSRLNEVSPSRKNMGLDAYQTILEQLSEFPRRIKSLVLNGLGEPTINPEFPAFLSATKEAGIADRVEFFTNALLLSPKLSERIVSSGVDRLKISLQGLNAGKYKEVAGVNADFDTLYENIKYYSQIRGKSQLYIKIINIGLRDEHDEEMFYRLFEPLADKVFVEHVMPWFNKQIDYSGMTVPGINKYNMNVSNREVCPIPFYRLYISVTGDVSTCYPHVYPMGKPNCFETHLIDIWTGPVRQAFLQEMLHKTYLAFDTCTACTLRCENTFSEYDDLDAHRELVLKNLGRSKYESEDH